MSDDRGASLVEYALLLVFILLAAIAALELVGQDNLSMWSEIESNIPS